MSSKKLYINSIDNLLKAFDLNLDFGLPNPECYPKDYYILKKLDYRSKIDNFESDKLRELSKLKDLPITQVREVVFKKTFLYLDDKKVCLWEFVREV